MPLNSEIGASAFQHVANRHESVLAEADTRRGSCRENVAGKQRVGYTHRKMSIDDYADFLSTNYDPTISWKEAEWIRDFWKGKLLIKGVLDPEDARDAVRFGADGLIVSNHGGRQLDGAIPTARALPKVADAVGNDLPVLADGGIRSGVDVVGMLALGARGVLLGRTYLYALAAAGHRGVSRALELFANDIRVTMTLIGVKSVHEIARDSLVLAN